MGSSKVRKYPFRYYSAGQLRGNEDPTFFKPANSVIAVLLHPALNLIPQTRFCNTFLTRKLSANDASISRITVGLHNTQVNNAT